MVNITYKIVTCLLLLIALVAVVSMSVQPKQIIYVGEVNGTLVPSCWEDETKLPCSGVEVALDGVELYNSTLVGLKHDCKRKKLQESAADAPHDQQCPAWFFPDPFSNGTCRCGDDIHNTVRCNDSTKEVSILDCYCMTYNKSTGPVVGACFYNCVHSALNDSLYDLVPSDVTKVNNNMCGHLN